MDVTDIRRHKMDNVQALNKFWNGFGLPAYDYTTVPKDVTMPYITYEVAEDFFGSQRQLAASLWYRSTSWKEITEKAKEISQFISRGGIMIPTDDGAMWIKIGTPWAQRLEEATDDSVRRIVLSVEIEFIS